MALNGLSVAVSGRIPGYTQDKLSKLITANGGLFSYEVNLTVTHLITSDAEFNKKTSKVKVAVDDIRTVNVVNIDWLLDSIAQNTRAIEKNYLYNTPGSHPNSRSAGSREQTLIAATPEPEEEQNVKKRGRQANMGVDAVAEIKEDDTEQTEQKKPAKVARGGVGDVAEATTSKKEVQEEEKRPTRSSRVSATKPKAPKEEPLAKDPQEEKKAPAKRGRGRGKTSGQTAATEVKMEDREEVETEGTTAVKTEDANAVPEKPVKRTRRQAPRAEDEEDENPAKRLKGKSRAPVPKSEAEKLVDGFASKIAEENSKTGKMNKQGIAPVDAHCPSAPTWKVYVDKSGVIYDAALNQTNIGVNNNKFYYVQLLEKNLGNSPTRFATWTHWGRVGENGQSALFHDSTLQDAMKIFQKKFKDKSGLSWENRFGPPKPGKYTVLEKNYDGDDTEDTDTDTDFKDTGSKVVVETRKRIKTDFPSSKLAVSLQKLVEFIFNPAYMQNSMAALKYDSNKLPLGKLSKKTIQQGYLALKAIGEILADPSNAQRIYGQSRDNALNELSSRYYTVIPHDFGRNRPPPITNEEILKREIELVETLGDLEIANEILQDTKYPVDSLGNPIHPLDAQFASLNLTEATPLEKSSSEFHHLSKYFKHSQYRNTEIVDIFHITRDDEDKRFTEGGFDADKVEKATNGKVKDLRRLLWHGSRASNFGGILSQGLRIAPPEAPVNGYAFDKGIYLADISSKSSGYCYYYNSDNTALLLLCEAQVGTPVYEVTSCDSRAATNSRNAGRLSTKFNAAAGPCNWLDAGILRDELCGVQMPNYNDPVSNWRGDNEYIVYSVAQVKLRYLFRVKFN